MYVLIYIFYLHYYDIYLSYVLQFIEYCKHFWAEVYFEFYGINTVIIINSVTQHTALLGAVFRRNEVMISIPLGGP